MTRMPGRIERLLDDLGQSDLAGDLAEELHAGRRSAAWAWWQILGAVAAASARIARRHPYLTFKAVTTAWIAHQILSGQLPFSPHLGFKFWYFRSAAWVLLASLQYFVAGWVVAHLSRRHRAAMIVAATAALIALNAADGALQLWIEFRMKGIFGGHGLSVVPALLWLVLPLTMVAGAALAAWPRQPRRGERMVRSTAFPVLLALVTAASAAAQSSDGRFDVASVKPSQPAAPASPAFPGVIPDPEGGVRAINVRLDALVRFAYDLDEDQLVGGPAWAQTARFDVIAKAAADADRSSSAVRGRLRALLQDRFGLKTHQETREMTVAALVLADKSGALGKDLKPTRAVCPGGADPICRTFVTGNRDADGRVQMVYRGVGQPLSALTRTIGQAIGQRVVDRTGLTGLYDYETEIPVDAQQMLRRARQEGVDVDPVVARNLAAADGPSMTSVLQRRLGLTLETQKAVVPILVIDAASLPSEN